MDVRCTMSKLFHLVMTSYFFHVFDKPQLSHRIDISSHLFGSQNENFLAVIQIQVIGTFCRYVKCLFPMESETCSGDTKYDKKLKRLRMKLIHANKTRLFAIILGCCTFIFGKYQQHSAAAIKGVGDPKCVYCINLLNIFVCFIELHCLFAIAFDFE